MKITLNMKDGTIIDCRLPYENANYMIPDGCCPECGTKDFMIVGTTTSHDNDTYKARAKCLNCGTLNGHIHLKQTLCLVAQREELMELQARGSLFQFQGTGKVTYLHSEISEDPYEVRLVKGFPGTKSEEIIARKYFTELRKAMSEYLDPVLFGRHDLSRSEWIVLKLKSRKDKMRMIWN